MRLLRFAPGDLVEDGSANILDPVDFVVMLKDKVRAKQLARDAERGHIMVSWAHYDRHIGMCLDGRTHGLAESVEDRNVQNIVDCTSTDVEEMRGFEDVCFIVYGEVGHFCNEMQVYVNVRWNFDMDGHGRFERTGIGQFLWTTYSLSVHELIIRAKIVWFPHAMYTSPVPGL
jgi:hypothetical protein